MLPSPALFHFKEIGSFKDTLKGSEKKKKKVVIRRGKTEADECRYEGVSLGLRRFYKSKKQFTSKSGVFWGLGFLAR